MSIKIANTNLNKDPYFINPIEDIKILKDKSAVDLFDQNGYHLTKAEQAFLPYNGYEPIVRRHEDCLRYDWLLWDKKEGAHINHSDLFERKGFEAAALQQLLKESKNNPMLWKLIKMKPKWGIDISIDYVSEDKCFEVFHYEWDSFCFEEVIEKKLEIEKFILNLNWDDIAIDLWKVKHEWINLDFFEQSQWRTDFFDLEPEKFKNVIWEE